MKRSRSRRTPWSASTSLQEPSSSHGEGEKRAATTRTPGPNQNRPRRGVEIARAGRRATAFVERRSSLVTLLVLLLTAVGIYLCAWKIRDAQMLAAIGGIFSGVGTLALVVGLWIQVSAARLTSKADLTLRLENRFTCELLNIRSKAARAILEHEDYAAAEDVLGFFETVALLTRRGVLDLEIVWCTFFYWEQRWFEAMRTYVETKRREEDDDAYYQELSWLDRRLRRVQAQESNPEKLDAEEIRRFLKEEQEATEGSRS